MKIFVAFRATAIVVFGLASAHSSWAAIAACDTSTPTGTAVSTSFSGSQSISNGCASLDKSLSNLSTIVSGSGVNTGNLLLLAGGTLNASGGNGTFTGEWQSTAFTNSSGGTNTKMTTFNYVVQAHTGDSLGGCTWSGSPACSPGYAAPSGGFAGQTWAINSITADMSSGRIQDLGSNDANAIVLLVSFCLGNSNLATTGSCDQTNGSSYGEIQITATRTAGGPSYTYVCQGLGTSTTNGCTTSGFTINSAGNVSFGITNPTTSISVFNTIWLNRQNLSGTVDLNSFLVSFGETAITPEPATFGLIGAALFGIGLLRRKRHTR